MHRCLAIDDIYFVILHHLREDEDVSDEEAATLAALARTCKTFQEPALDRLWCSMRALEPFMKCLDASKWSPDGRGDIVRDPLNPMRKSDRMLSLCSCSSLLSEPMIGCASTTMRRGSDS